MVETEFFNLYWERSEFISFGSLPGCHCYYAFEDFITHQSGTILLPPSPNWFLCDSVDCRSEDGLMVTASFKSIVVYHVTPDERLPKILKMIPYNNKKVLVVRLCPNASDPDFGHSVASSGEGGEVKVHNLHNGTVTSHHNHHQDSSVNGVCWGSVGGETVVVSVGGGGRMVVWQPKFGVHQMFTFKQFKDISLVEVNPKSPSQAVLAADRNIALVSLKDGKVLTMLQGHDYTVYCMKWYPGEEGSSSSSSPFTEEAFVTNSRAEAMMNTGKRTHKPMSNEGDKKDNWRSNNNNNSHDATQSTGPFLASSDYGRNVLVWDLSAKKFVTKFNVPFSTSGYKKQPVGKDKGVEKQHIPLAWHNTQLLSSTIRGELLNWTLWPGSAKYKTLHHLHTRVLYTIHVIGDQAITTGQDRYFRGYDLSIGSHSFSLPTLGGFATSLSFCPQDANRLAIGSQENSLRVLNFGGEIPLQTLTVWQKIKGKIYTLSWHPEHEGRLLFGTASGQVGWTDTANGHISSFAYYHQKSVYKVEWAPPVCPQNLDKLDSWCAYSFGDKEIVIRSPSDLMADPVSWRSLLPESVSAKAPKDITEFSFSPDYKFLAVGALDGQVVVYRCSDLALMVTIMVVRKSIQHLLWQPTAPQNPPYILAVGSNEHKIYIFHLDTILNGNVEGEVLTQAAGELCGHESRVVWLAWSPHNTGTLASASYDHTIQLWDTNTGKPLVNYGGHTSRVFRVEFSPLDPDLMYSFAEENCVHTWRPSLQSHKTPSDGNAVLKNYKKEHEAATTSTLSEDSLPLQEAKEKKGDGNSSKDEVRSATCVNVNSSSNSSISSEVGGSKKAAFKSFFPKFHSVATRKKSFHHLTIMNMLAKQQAEGQQGTEKRGQEGVTSSSEEDLEEENELEKGCEDEATTKERITEVSEKYKCLLEKDVEMASPDSFSYMLNMYGSLEQMDSLLAEEIQVHESKGNVSHAGLMHCWRGSLDEHITSAARHKKLTPFLVAAAPHVSFKLGQVACEAYAEQLVEEGDVIAGATHLVIVNKIKEAVDILTRHKYFREAYTVARCRLGYDDELRATVIKKWVSCSIYDGNYDLAATLQLSEGWLQEAARTLSRRVDPGSLFVAGQLYQAAGRGELAQAMGTAALREAALRQEITRIEPFLAHMPELSWFRAIFCCLQVLLHVLRKADKQTIFSYLIESDQDIEEVENREEHKDKLSKMKKQDGTGSYGVAMADARGSGKDERSNDNKKSTDNKPCELGETEKQQGDSTQTPQQQVEKNEGENGHQGIVKENSPGTDDAKPCERNGEGGGSSILEAAAEELETVVERVRREWKAQGITQDQHDDIYKAVTANFSTQQLPTSLKQLWLMVSVAMTEMLLSPSPSHSHKHLHTALNHVQAWGKADQALHLTHLLLPKGTQDLSSLGPAFVSKDGTVLPCIKTLLWLYHVSELSLLNSHVQGEGFWSAVRAEGDQGMESVEELTEAISTKLGFQATSTKTLEKSNIDVSDEKINGATSDSVQELGTGDMETAKETNGVGETSNTNNLQEEAVEVTHIEDTDTTASSTAPSKDFKLPQSKMDLLVALHSCLNGLKSQQQECQEQPHVEASSGFSNPKKFLQEIVDKLRSEGSCSENELLSLLDL
ncbi:hypothetical protein Pcinc_041767 [Petrolisthes cinctipes]|uniref:Gem-associated protein 5 n=1 Tax=Petrolisthes cinctipes TaxID=88211 RepID=A0AAE1BLX4_PETCI|nr:hypothetical protein Pcinc_041767 [Petrolisthes cinctipes]